MAEENEATSSASRIRQPGQKSNWLLDAALAGLGASFVMGPAGLLVGVGRGIANRRADRNALDAMAEERSMIEAANQDVDAQLKRMGQLPGITDIDKEQLNTLQSQRVMLSRMMNSADPNVRTQATERYLALMDGANSWLDDVESRQNEQQDQVRGTYVDAFKDLKDRYRTTVDSVQQAKQGSTELLSFIDGMSEDELNKPFNRARIAQLIESSARSLMVDTPDTLDAIGGAVGGISGVAPNPILQAVGSLVKGGLEAIKSGDFRITPSQVRHLAMTNIRTTEQFAKEKLDRYGNEAKALTGTGQRFGIVADNDTVFRYVTGQSEDAPVLPASVAPKKEPRTDSAPVSRTKPSTGRVTTPQGPTQRQQALLSTRPAPTELPSVPSAADVLSSVRQRMTNRKRPVND